MFVAWLSAGLLPPSFPGGSATSTVDIDSGGPASGQTAGQSAPRKDPVYEFMNQIQMQVQMASAAAAAERQRSDVARQGQMGQMGGIVTASFDDL